MGKIKAKVKKLKKKISKLKKQLKATAPSSKTSNVSPLAPKGGFPKLPVIDGVRFAAGHS